MTLVIIEYFEHPRTFVRCRRPKFSFSFPPPVMKFGTKISVCCTLYFYRFFLNNNNLPRPTSTTNGVHSTSTITISSESSRHVLYDIYPVGPTLNLYVVFRAAQRPWQGGLRKTNMNSPRCSKGSLIRSTTFKKQKQVDFLRVLPYYLCCQPFGWLSSAQHCLPAPFDQLPS